MSEESKKTEGCAEEPEEGPGGPEQEGRFPELERLQQEIERQIRSNQRFLERFLDEDYQEEDEPEEDEEEFEEL